MRLAAIRYGTGEPTKLPYRAMRIVVAEQFGVAPGDVDRWPASDVYDAAAVTSAIAAGRKAVE